MGLAIGWWVEVGYPPRRDSCLVSVSRPLKSRAERIDRIVSKLLISQSSGKLGVDGAASNGSVYPFLAQ